MTKFNVEITRTNRVTMVIEATNAEDATQKADDLARLISWGATGPTYSIGQAIEQTRREVICDICANSISDGSSRRVTTAKATTPRGYAHLACYRRVAA